MHHGMVVATSFLVEMMVKLSVVLDDVLNEQKSYIMFHSAEKYFLKKVIL